MNPRRRGRSGCASPSAAETIVSDVVVGDTAFPNENLDDPVIARADGTPVYNLAVAIDDLDAGITHVVRGIDHLANTPKQMWVLEAMGATPPVYGHLPLLHGPDGKKLSKRHGAASVQELRDAGYLPEAVDNYIALLGAGFASDEEFFTLPELAERFRLERVSKNSAIFDERKLRHLDGRHLRELSVDELTERLERFTGRTGLRGAAAISREKIQTLGDFWPLVSFLFDGPVDDPAAFERTIGSDGGVETLTAAREALAAVAALRQRARRDGAARRRRGARAQGRQGLSARAGGDRRADRLAGDLRERRAPRSRGDAVARRRRPAARSLAARRSGGVRLGG